MQYRRADGINYGWDSRECQHGPVQAKNSNQSHGTARMIRLQGTRQARATNVLSLLLPEAHHVAPSRHSDDEGLSVSRSSAP